MFTGNRNITVSWETRSCGCKFEVTYNAIVIITTNMKKKIEYMLMGDVNSGFTSTGP
jgi:hypothetical protein